MEMQVIADLYNNEVLDTTELEKLIEENGWISDFGTTYGICHNQKEQIVINDEGKAIHMYHQKNY